MGQHEMNVTGQGEVDEQHTEHPELRREVVEVTVAYLPAPKPFHRKYGDETVIGVIRTDAMQFFGVHDHQDRDKHEFFLEFEGRRLADMSETLEKLLGRHRREAHFNLIEQIMQGPIQK
jgi:hypothetical protein